MTKRKRVGIWMWIAISMLFLIVLGGVVLVRAVPGVGTQLAGRKPAILLSIAEPYHEQQVLPSATISVFVTVTSARELQSVVAYADGNPLVPVISSPLETNPVTAWFAWSPATEGWHVLVARATDIDGFTAISNPVRVIAAPSPTLPPVAITPLDMPMTILGISSDTPDFDTEFDADVERLLSQWQGGQPVPLQAPTFTLPDLQVPSAPLNGDIVDAPAPASSFQKMFLWAVGSTNIPGALPPAPELRGSVEGCAVRLVIEDQAENELGYRIYRLSPVDTSWALVADLQASAGRGLFETLDADRNPGRYEYYAASYNASGENPGNIIALEVTSGACDQYGSRSISLQHAILTPALPVDRLYCYASQDGSSWERIPPNPKEFIRPVDGIFDLSLHLHALGVPGTPLDLVLDCWGWQGGTLLSLGRGSGNFGTMEGPLQFDADSYRFEADTLFAPIDPGDRIPALLTIVPPVNLHYPDSLGGCLAYDGDDASMEWACENLINPLTGESTSGHNLLVWHYYDFCQYEGYCEGYLPYSEIDGFHVNRQTKNVLDQWNEPILIRTVTPYEVMMAVLSPGETTSATSRTRYFVRAFVSGGLESADSNYLQPIPANFRMTIPAQFIQGISVRVFKPTKTVGVDIEPGPLGSIRIVSDGDTSWVPNTPVLEEQTEDGFLVGYFRHHSDGMPRSTSLIYDAWVQFDLSQVPGTITNATLSWDGDLEMTGPGWDKWETFCGNQLTTFYGWPVDYVTMLLPFMDVNVTNYVLLQQQADAIQYPVGGMAPQYFGFYMWSGMRDHYTTDYLSDACMARIKNVRLEVEYTK